MRMVNSDLKELRVSLVFNKLSFQQRNVERNIHYRQHKKGIRRHDISPLPGHEDEISCLRKFPGKTIEPVLA